MSDTLQSRTSFWVDVSEAELRLDVVVTARLEEVSRAHVKRLITSGRIRVNGEPARPSRLCREGEEVDVEIPAPDPAEPEPEPLPLSIVFEDESLIVVDKAPGMVVHPGPGHPRGTLVNALLAHCNDLSGIGGVERPGIVHRLDVGTSGVLVVAKHDRAHQALARAFQNREVDKRYVAIAHGTTPDAFVIDLPIGRDPVNRTKISSRGSRTKQALTEVKKIQSLESATYLAIRLHTGRTHQIRVHLSEAGYPLVGDRDYGASSRRLPRGLAEFPRPALHARALTLDHPVTGQPVTWEAPVPADMLELLEKLS